MQIVTPRYEIKGRLGQGGMGIVYHACDCLTQQDIALKQVLVNPNQLQFSSKGGKDKRLALTQEFRTP